LSDDEDLGGGEDDGGVGTALPEADSGVPDREALDEIMKGFPAETAARAEDLWVLLEDLPDLLSALIHCWARTRAPQLVRWYRCGLAWSGRIRWG
jgi:hypothetical protein